MIPRLERRRRTPRPAGGWLITYADLMTILVCFFVLIVSYSIQDQVKMEVVAGSMRDAFGVAEERRYAGDIKLQGTPEQRQPGNIRPSPSPTASGLAETLSAHPSAGAEGAHGAFATASADRRRYEDAKAALEKAITSSPLLKDFAKAITINLVDDGMQIVLVDIEGQPMFASGSAALTPRAEALLKETARALLPLPNRIVVEGHADATGSGAYSPFELTAARANAARKSLEDAGFPAARIAGVAGRGAAIPLYPENPYAAANRRIEIVLEPAASLLPEKRSL
ncbi:MAG: flagellar motor protein MotB [Pseudomonadota bacterium]|nr:flagellar motor protein MotB [Pseudomonadota bacterium]